MMVIEGRPPVRNMCSHWHAHISHISHICTCTHHRHPNPPPTPRAPLLQVATAIRGAIILAKMSVIPVRRGYWGNKIGKVGMAGCRQPACRAVGGGCWPSEADQFGIGCLRRALVWTMRAQAAARHSRCRALFVHAPQAQPLPAQWPQACTLHATT